MMNSVSFEEYCRALGVNVEFGELSFCVPPVHEGVIHFRAFCLAELLIKKVYLEDISWAEVKNIFTYSEDKIYALIQFNSCESAFPMEIPLSALFGTKESIEIGANKILKDLPERIRVWLKVTKHGFKKMTLKEFHNKLGGRSNLVHS
ncbi:hypothetical protein EHV15_35495 [Paenibacillus oralis]|uniref:Uncharacterized protein n=1 Tax=Paenibacillus oralis TaxID=2490856 RepID=A0A3P3TA14_9BACL|nr:hypothetical protein [Paenibacillus oralis]RRJ54881.1 hypothetical protein EHV15_35495 [Paenibacillus oralis]